MEALDDVDRSLIWLLQEDGRASYATLAAKVGLSAAAVRNRVNRLFDQGIVKGMVVIDPLKLGYQIAAVVGISCAGSLDPAIQAIEGSSEVDCAVVSSGRYDLMVEIACFNTEHLMERVEEFRKIEGAVDVEVIVVLKYLRFGQNLARAQRVIDPLEQ